MAACTRSGAGGASACPACPACHARRQVILSDVDTSNRGRRSHGRLRDVSQQSRERSPASLCSSLCRGEGQDGQAPPASVALPVRPGLLSQVQEGREPATPRRLRRTNGTTPADSNAIFCSLKKKKKKKKTKCFLTGRIALSRNKLREQDDFRQHKHRRSCMWAECGPRRPTEVPRMPRMSFRLSRRAGD